MSNFYVLIACQCIIFGLAVFGYITSIISFVTISGWGAKVCNFFVAHLFFIALVLIGFYWYDTIETKNTFFSDLVPKLIEIKTEK